MIIREVKVNKKRYMKLLFLADEQESMIDKYLERGRMFVLAPETALDCSRLQKPQICMKELNFSSLKSRKPQRMLSLGFFLS